MNMYDDVNYMYKFVCILDYYIFEVVSSVINNLKENLKNMFS